MALTYPIPKASSAIADGRGSPTPEWYNFFRTLLGNQSGEDFEAQLQALTARVAALEEGESATFIIQGGNSITVYGTPEGGVVQIGLFNDVNNPGPTYHYATDETGLKGWYPVERALAADAGELTKTVDPDTGITSFGLAAVSDSGTGTLRGITRDGYGRVTGTTDATITGTAGQIVVANGDAAAGRPTLSLADVTPTAGGALQKTAFDAKGRRSQEGAATTDDLPEGVNNLYFTDERADARIEEQKGQPNGLATLDADAKLQANQLPALAITETFVVADETAMLALDAQQGDVAVRTDEQKSYILTAEPASTLANWQELLTPTGTGGTVTSVDIANATGISFTGGPITGSGTFTPTLSANLQAWHGLAPSAKENAITAGTIAQYWRGDKTWRDFATDVRAAVLTGLSTATNAVITATDTVLQALGKLQAQVTGKYDKTGGIISGNVHVIGGNGFGGGDPLQSALFIATNSAGVNGAATFSLFTGAGSSFDFVKFSDAATPAHQVIFNQRNDAGFDFYTNNGARWRVAHSAFLPLVDNAFSLGTASNRPSQLYAASGTINTSDAREKTEPRDLSPDELSAAMEIARLPSIFQWLASIEKKGGSARLHCSPTVQSVIAVMRSHGLDPFRYGFICHDEWGELPEIVTTWDEERDKDGNLIREAGSIVAQRYRAAGDRYSLRPSELAHFIMRGIVARLDAAGIP